MKNKSANCQRDQNSLIKNTIDKDYTTVDCDHLHELYPHNIFVGQHFNKNLGFWTTIITIIKWCVKLTTQDLEVTEIRVL